MELSLFYFDGAIANLSMLSFPQNRRGLSPILRTKVKMTNHRDTPGRATDLGVSRWTAELLVSRIDT